MEIVRAVRNTRFAILFLVSIPLLTVLFYNFSVGDHPIVRVLYSTVITIWMFLTEMVLLLVFFMWRKAALIYDRDEASGLRGYAGIIIWIVYGMMIMIAYINAGFYGACFTFLVLPLVFIGNKLILSDESLKNMY